MGKFTTDDGITLNYVVRGAGRRGMIYLHSMGGNLGTWHGLWDHLDCDGYRHVALDFRGHGGSTKKPCEVTNERLSRDVLQLADSLGLERFAVVGHSMGVKVGMQLAAMAPKRVGGLGLIGSPSPGLVPFRREDMADFMATYQDRAVTEAFFRPWFKVWPCAAANAWVRSFADMPDWVLHATVEMPVWTDITDAIHTINTPTLVVAGTDDPIYGPEYQCQQVLPAFSQARLVTIPECGHGLILEQPRKIAVVLEAFFAEMDGM